VLSIAKNESLLQHLGRGSFSAILCGAWLFHYDEEHNPAQEKL
jgi:hypothetical protein